MDLAINPFEPVSGHARSAREHRRAEADGSSARTQAFGGGLGKVVHRAGVPSRSGGLRNFELKEPRNFAAITAPRSPGFGLGAWPGTSAPVDPECAPWAWSSVSALALGGPRGFRPVVKAVLGWRRERKSTAGGVRRPRPGGPDELQGGWYQPPTSRSPCPRRADRHRRPAARTISRDIALATLSIAGEARGHVWRW